MLHIGLSCGFHVVGFSGKSQSEALCVELLYLNEGR